MDTAQARDYCDRGTRATPQGDLRGAVADFQRALEIDPDYPEAWNNRGAARHALGTSPARPPTSTAPWNSAPATPRPTTTAASSAMPWGTSPGRWPTSTGPWRSTPLRRSAEEPSDDPPGTGGPRRGGRRPRPGDRHRPARCRSLPRPGGGPPGAGRPGRGARRLRHGPAALPAPSPPRSITCGPASASAQRRFADALADCERALEIDPGFCMAYISRGNARYHLRDLAATRGLPDGLPDRPRRPPRPRSSASCPTMCARTPTPSWRTAASTCGSAPTTWSPTRGEA